jgi:hypothetical protein
MSDASTRELIDNLRRSLRRWKTLALILVGGLGLVSALGVGAAFVQVQRVRAARDAAMEARQRAAEAQDQATRNLEKARQTLDALLTRVVEDATGK